MLNDMRRGVVSAECQAILTQKMYDTTRDMRAEAALQQAKEGSQTKISENLKHTCLFSRNADCDRANEIELNKLPLINKTSEGDMLSQDEGRHFIYAADETGPVDMLKNFKAPQELELRVGAQVMCLKNLDQERGLINGSRGIVTHFVDFDQENREVKAFSSQPLPVVQFHINRGGEESIITEVIQPANFEVTLGDKVLACRRQLPLMLAWAVSIHKSQGLTIPFLNVSFDGIFEYGQAYVALSRATDLEGLRLRGFAAKYIKAHPEVRSFYERLGYDVNESEKISTDLQLVSVAQLSAAYVRELPPGPAMDRDEWIESTSTAKKRKSSNTIIVDPSKREFRTKTDKHGDSTLASGKDGGVETANGKLFSMFAYKAEGSIGEYASGKANIKPNYQQKHQQNMPNGSGYSGGAVPAVTQGAGGSLSGLATWALQQQQQQQPAPPPIARAAISSDGRHGSAGTVHGRPPMSLYGAGSCVGSSSSTTSNAPRPGYLSQPLQHSYSFPGGVTSTATSAAAAAAAAPAAHWELTEEQRQQIERNKALAQQRRAAAQQRKEQESMQLAQQSQQHYHQQPPQQPQQGPGGMGPVGQQQHPGELQRLFSMLV